jgi:hypothetical protein
MRKLFKTLCAVLFLTIGLSSCVGGFETNFDESLLYGKWQEGSTYERYYDSNIDFVLPTGETVQVNGTTWDESDDVSEDEAQAFRWTLDGTTLTQIHVGAFTDVPMVYTVTSLTSSSLCYEDAYGTKHQFSKTY